MSWLPRSRMHLCLLGIAGVSLLAGCRQDSGSSYERYIPPTEVARANLARVMENWLKGLSPGESGSKQPEVHVVDQTRRADQRPVRYEILGEIPAENARAFAVRVHYEGVERPEIVRFVALGVDPMWIFRQEDYENIWNHQEPTPVDRVGEPAGKP